MLLVHFPLCFRNSSCWLSHSFWFSFPLRERLWYYLGLLFLLCNLILKLSRLVATTTFPSASKKFCQWWPCWTIPDWENSANSFRRVGYMTFVDLRCTSLYHYQWESIKRFDFIFSNRVREKFTSKQIGLTIWLLSLPFL